MRERFPRLSSRERSSRAPLRLPFATWLSDYVRTLSPGDKVIATVLGLAVVVTSLLGARALERHFLVVQPAYGGTLSEGVVGAPRFVNPLLALSDTDRDLVALTYAGLMGYDQDAHLVPVLAKSYEVSDNGTVYTFILRDGATFSDGTPVTADDIVYTVKKAQDPALKSPVLSDWAGIGVEAVDAHTVKFTLPKAYAPFLEDATLGILPAHLWKSVSDEDFPFSPLTTEPVGAGPFKAAGISRSSDQSISKYALASFSGYALGRPYLSGITFTFFADTDALTTALKDGSVASGYGVPLPGARTAPYARVFGVFFDSDQNAALTSTSVRKALSLAIDRNSITQGVFGGYASALYGPVPAGNGIRAAAASSSADRLAAARTALTSAGWDYDNASNSWSKAGNTLAITLTTANVPELKESAASIAADWNALGVATALELHDPNELTQDIIRPRSYQALLFGEVVGSENDLYAFWDGSQRAAPGLNIANYENPAVDTLLAKLRTEQDPAQKALELQQANDLIAADYPAAFTHTPEFLYVVPKTLSGVVLPEIASPSDRFATAYRWYLRSEAVWPFLARHEGT